MNPNNFGFNTNVQEDGSHTEGHRKVGHGGLISPTLTLSMRWEGWHNYNNGDENWKIGKDCCFDYLNEIV